MPSTFYTGWLPHQLGKDRAQDRLSAPGSSRTGLGFCHAVGGAAECERHCVPCGDGQGPGAAGGYERPRGHTKSTRNFCLTAQPWQGQGNGGRKLSGKWLVHESIPPLRTMVKEVSKGIEEAFRVPLSLGASPQAHPGHLPLQESGFHRDLETIPS